MRTQIPDQDVIAPETFGAVAINHDIAVIGFKRVPRNPLIDGVDTSAHEIALRSIAELDLTPELDARLTLALCVSIARAALQREARA